MGKLSREIWSLHYYSSLHSFAAVSCTKAGMGEPEKSVLLIRLHILQQRMSRFTTSMHCQNELPNQIGIFKVNNETLDQLDLVANSNNKIF